MTLSGLIVSVMTPFDDDGAVDLDAFDAHLRWLVGEGVHGVMIAGTAGEFASLESAERRAMAEHAVRVVAGDVPVIVHTGHMSRREALVLAEHADGIGADAVMSTPPAFVKPTQAEIAAYFTELAAKVGVDVVMYNNPGRVGVTMTPATIAELAAVPNIVAMKESGRSLGDTSDTIDLVGDSLAVLSGEGDLYLPTLALGGRGAILTVCNVLPRAHVELYDAYTRGDLAAAQALHHALVKLGRELGKGGQYHAAIKAAMREKGIPVGPPRLPLTDVGPAGLERVRAALAAFDAASAPDRAETVSR